MAVPDTRSIALQIMDTMRREDRLATAVLRELLYSRDLPPGVAAGANRLVLGTLRDRGYLDHMLESLMERGLPRKDARLLDLLRLALYELLTARAVPTFATVDRFVALAQAIKGKRVGGFVNAVLRKAARLDRESLVEERSRLPANIRLSLPDWVCEEASLTFGDRWESEMEALNEPSPIALRCPSPQVASEVRKEFQDAGLHPWDGQVSECSLVLPSDEPPYQTMAFAKGRFWPQDEASQLVNEVVAALAGDPLLDACAGQGTKTLALAAGLQDHRIIAADLLHRRVSGLRERVGRVASVQIPAVTADLRSPPFAPGSLARVLLDAPCTGIGTARRHPELLWRRNRKDLRTNSKVQKKLLESLSRTVMPGGYLVYVVCSFLNSEGSKIIQSFLDRHPDWMVADVTAVLPEPARGIWCSLVDYTRLLPGVLPGTVLTSLSILGGDMFYIAVLRFKKE
jgi:16S rRNA (cytosine967-C5)-methyltransferase